MHMTSMIFCKRISCTPANHHSDCDRYGHVVLLLKGTVMPYLKKTEISDCLVIVTHHSL